MSWSVSAVGKAEAVAAKVEADLSAYRCCDPEESVKAAVRAALVASLKAQHPTVVVRVTASGHQSGSEHAPLNTVRIEVEPIGYFLE